MQGILIVDKPMGWTSFDVIAKLRGILGTRKLGHSGTLDPMATGVLPVFCGGASKAVDLQLDHTKTYCARLKLGLRTDTHREKWIPKNINEGNCDFSKHGKVQSV